jgi:glycosyltransferase involved in cell wall biosynthesis
MSVGLPVIATAVGGNTDAIVNGETGLLVAAKAPHELSAAILALAADPARRARMGKAASDRVEKVFSLTACVARYVRLYQGAAAIGTMAVQHIIEGTDKTGKPIVRTGG